MSDFYRLFIKDDRFNNFIFRDEMNKSAYRDQYKSFVCCNCGKIDELVALKIPVPKNLTYKSQWDISMSIDGILCFNEKAKNIYNRYSMEGLEFISINNTGYHIAVPLKFVNVDMGISGFETTIPKCYLCKRDGENIIGPLLRSINTGTEYMSFLCPDIMPESVLGRDFLFCVHKNIINLLKKEGVTGIEPIDY